MVLGFFGQVLSWVVAIGLEKLSDKRSGTEIHRNDTLFWLLIWTSSWWFWLSDLYDQLLRGAIYHAALAGKGRALLRYDISEPRSPRLVAVSSVIL